MFLYLIQAKVQLHFPLLVHWPLNLHVIGRHQPHCTPLIEVQHTDTRHGESIPWISFTYEVISRNTTDSETTTTYLWAMYESMWKALSTRCTYTPGLMIGWSWQGCYVKDHGHVTRTWHLIGCHCSTSHVHRTLKKGKRTCFLQLLHTFNYYINVYWDFGTPIQLSTVQSVTTA